MYYYVYPVILPKGFPCKNLNLNVYFSVRVSEFFIELIQKTKNKSLAIYSKNKGDRIRVSHIS